jgi:ATP-dependent Lhr-like helicase
LPFWRGDALGRTAELGRAIGAFTRELAARGRADALGWLREQGLDAWAAANLVDYVAEQQSSGSHLPTDRTLVVERSRDELGDWRLTVLSPYGARVHAPWALLARERLSERFGVDAAVLHSDDGIVARLPDMPGDDWLGDATACLFPAPDEVEPGVTRLIGSSALFAARFREAAARALLLPRPRPGRRAPLWQQRQRSAQLLQVAAEHPTFPIVLEAVRECLQDVYDLPALVQVMTEVEHRRIRVVEASPLAASPFARALLFGYVAEYLYEGDSPLAERRAAALTLDPTLLGELLGTADLRELLEPEAIQQVVDRLQHLAPDRHARAPEDAVDLLRVLGPLSADAASLRGVQAAWLTDLDRQRRVFTTRIAGAEVWAVVEDAPRLRDGVGAPLPPGLPEAHLRPVDDPIGDLVSRYSRTHGPFTTAQAAAALGLAPAVVGERLARARADGRVVEGRFLAGEAGTQWCHQDVLRMIKRRSVALLRHQIEPVSQAALAVFLPRWQSIGSKAVPRLRGVEGVLEVARLLAGVPLPVSALETSILPARVADYAPSLLDELTGTGEVVWTGTASLPGGDAWVALAPADAAFLLPRSPTLTENPSAETLLDMLRQGGGWFLADLVRRLGPDLTPDQVGEALRALLWAGLVSNDTLEPVRSARDRARASRRSGASAARPRLARPPRGRYADLWRPRSAHVLDGPAAGSTTAGGPAPPRIRTVDLPGRWFALPDPADDPLATAVGTALAHLDRLGLVTRGAVLAAGDAGGFAAAYRTLSAMEERGRVQRVYAVDGLGAAQFALPGVVDQLRDVERELADGVHEAIVLACADPANAYGAALEWPASDWAAGSATPHRPSRSAGSNLVLVGDRPVLYLERGGHSLLTFTGTQQWGEEDPATILGMAAAALVAAVHDGGVAPAEVTRVNGLPALAPQDAARSVVAVLIDAGFTPTPRGVRVRR